MADKGFEPGSMGCHEALHMASYFAGAVDEELCEHPAIKGNKEWRKLAIKAVDALGDLYNAIGRDHLSFAPPASQNTLHAEDEG